MAWNAGQNACSTPEASSFPASSSPAVQQCSCPALAPARLGRVSCFSNERSILAEWGGPVSPCMASSRSAAVVPARSRRARPAGLPALDTQSRFDRRLAEILGHATEVFCEKGYEGASMRDLSRATGMSLAGLYYYFESKERLLYLIQRHTFTTILERLRERLEHVADPEQRLRVFIQNHIEYFLAHSRAMKVLSHEDDVLKNAHGEQIASIKREYYRICRELVEALKREHALEFPSRLAVLSLFGMMNWIYTWHNPRVDADTGELARRMGDIFMRGMLGQPSRAVRMGKSTS
jgi:TetR/AcrR family transcriptional regulator, cholesterol catabolism regulator